MSLASLTFVDYDHDGDIDLYVAEGPSNQSSRPTTPIVVKPFRATALCGGITEMEHLRM